MDKLLISVLMPVWNRSHLVRNAIQSIWDQTYKDWEFVIVDDGSDDGTWAVLKECMQKDKRIRAFRRKRERLVKALTFGNDMCAGNIIVKQDSDDLSLPDRLEKIIKYFEENPNTDFLYHGMYQTYGDGNPDPTLVQRLYISAIPIVEKRIFREQYIPGAFIYTKKFITETPYRQLHCSEDWMLILDAFYRGYKIGTLDVGLYEYILRADSNSMMHENTGNYEEDELTMKQILEQEYGKPGFKYAERK